MPYEPKMISYTIASYFPKMREEDILRLNGINIAFASVGEDFRIHTDRLVGKEYVQRYKALNPALKIMISVGGWGADGFSQAAATEEGRKLFSESCVKFVEEWNLDGVDIDWEFPCYPQGIEACPEDKFTYTLLLKQLREDLDALGARKKGKHYILSAAVANDLFYIDGVELDKIDQYLDYFQLMTYDMRNGMTVLTGHHSNLFCGFGDFFRLSCDNCVDLFLERGIAKEKIVIGAAFYSRWWHDVPNERNGLFMTSPKGGDYGPDYSALKEAYINKNGYVRYWDDDAKAPWLFNGSTFISYDDPESIACKMRYVQDKGIAGIMFWEYSNDTTGELVKAIFDHRLGD